MGGRAPQSKEWPGGRDMLGGLTGPRGGSVAVARRASGELMGRGGCGVVLRSGHSLASVSAEPASHMSVGLVESAEAWAAHSTVPGPEPPAPFSQPPAPGRGPGRLRLPLSPEAVA